MSAKTIYDRLINAGMTETGAMAMLCNMYAESGLKANIAQRGMTKLTDEQYTAAADAGTINFVNDAVGYGLCQWTFWSRKKWLLEFCRERGVSAGNEAAQVEFCIAELKTDYPSLWQYLCSTGDLYTAVDRVCREYERPAVNNVDTRYGYASVILSLINKDESDNRASSGLLTEDAPIAAAAALPPEGEAKRYAADMAVLCRGFYGSQVAMLQKLLSISADGIFGAETERAVKMFQEKSGLTADGIAGAKTFEKLTN